MQSVQAVRIRKRSADAANESTSQFLSLVNILRLNCTQKRNQNNTSLYYRDSLLVLFYYGLCSFVKTSLWGESSKVHSTNLASSLFSDQPLFDLCHSINQKEIIHSSDFPGIVSVFKKEKQIMSVSAREADHPLFVCWLRGNFYKIWVIFRRRREAGAAD